MAASLNSSNSSDYFEMMERLSLADVDLFAKLNPISEGIQNHKVLKAGAIQWPPPYFWCFWTNFDDLGL